MFIPMPKIIVLCVAVAAAAAAPNVQNDIFYRGHLPKTRIGSMALKHPGSMAKTPGQVWKQVGAMHYTNSAPSGSPVQWNFNSRDTMVYDAAGNLILKKNTSAHSGWETDSVRSVDSLVYRVGLLVEGIHMHYPDVGSSDTWGGHNTYTYPDGGKNFVETEYNFSAPHSWVPHQKDSLAFCAPVIYKGSNWNDYSHFIGEYLFTYDSTTSSWKSFYTLTKVDAECDSTTMVLQGREKDWSISGDDTVDFAYVKKRYTFSSLDWSDQTLVEIREQTKKTAAGTYIDVSKDLISSGMHEYDKWDTAAKTWVCWDKIYHDALGNDTFWFHRPNAQDWWTKRLARTYDANGNNIVTISSFCNSESEETWKVTDKDTNIFARINVPVVRQIQAPSRQKVSMAISPGLVRFSAPGITALNLYNAAGRLVASVKQQAAPSICLRLSKSQGSSIQSGAYIAKLTSKNRKNACTVPIY